MEQNYAAIDRMFAKHETEDNPSDAIKRFIEKRRAVEGAATPGPWIVAHCDYAPGGFNDDILIADARNSLPLALAIIEELAGALESIEHAPYGYAVTMREYAKSALSKAAAMIKGAGK